MRILVTNDDGIGAEGLVRLVRMATRLGETVVAAPDCQYSGCSHSVTFRHDIPVRSYVMPRVQVRAYSVSGTPADCVRIAMDALFIPRPDVTFVGINHGLNCGTDLQYSGTLGAGLESLLYGVPAICFSEDLGGSGEVSDYYMRDIADEILRCNIAPPFLYNVNFPAVSLPECRGILRDRIPASHGCYEDHYDIEEIAPGKYNTRLLAKRVDRSEAGSDLQAVLDGWISIGTLRSVGNSGLMWESEASLPF